jgi:hypothetical protein
MSAPRGWFARIAVWGLLVLLVHVPAMTAGLGDVLFEQKISREVGNFDGDVRGGDAFGFGVEALGDLDGDGTPDVAVGAPGDNGQKGANEGSFYVLFLAPDATARSSTKYLPDKGPVAVPDAELGIDLANLGDVDGDGVVDLAVGAPLHHEKDKPRTGTVWIVFLNPDGTAKSTVKVDGAGSGFDGDLDKKDWFGDGVAGIGDLDGDGVPDLAVGAPGDDDGDGADKGAVWILFLRRDGLVDRYQKISARAGGFGGGLDPYEGFGAAVGSIGDVDRDGVTDLAVGVPYDDSGGSGIRSWPGSVWILFMNTDGTVKNQNKISKSNRVLASKLNSDDLFGWDVTGVGDFDGDGVPDIAVGAPGDDDGDNKDRGAFYIVYLATDGSAKAVHKVSDTAGGFEGRLRSGDRFGASVAALGDLDGDGVTEICVGAPQDDDGSGDNAGAIWNLFMEGSPVVCGDADSNGSVSSTDASIALRAAVGTASCEACRCDVNASGGITATDAQAVLAAAVGLSVELVCPACS